MTDLLYPSEEELRGIELRLQTVYITPVDLEAGGYGMYSFRCAHDIETVKQRTQAAGFQLVSHTRIDSSQTEYTVMPAQSAPRGSTAAADDAPITRTEVAYALINTLYQDMKQNPDDGKKALAYFRELADARLSDVYDLMDERSELRAQLAAARERERALASALAGCIGALELVMNHEGGKGIVGLNITLAIMLKAAREALAAQAQQPGRADGYAVGQEVILLDGTSLIGQVIEKGYKVSLDGSEGRWYNAAELAAYVAGKAQDAASE